MSYFPPVTAHAILRYLTRIEDFDLRPIVKQLGRDAGNWPLARAAAERLGVPVAELQKRICPEHLAPAVRGGAGRIRREGLVLVCSGGLVGLHPGGHPPQALQGALEARAQGRAAAQRSAA